jgi:hypothetical protein
MGVPALEVGYTSATTGRGDHEVHKGHVLEKKKQVFPKQHSTNSLHSVDVLCSLWSKKRGFICSLNKPSAWHPISVFDRPTEDAEFLRKFRVAMHASHAALSKSTSISFFARTQSSRRCQNVEVSRNAKIISTAVCTYSPFPLPSAHPEALPCLQPYFTRRTNYNYE